MSFTIAIVTSASQSAWIRSLRQTMDGRGVEVKVFSGLPRLQDIEGARILAWDLSGEKLAEAPDFPEGCALALFNFRLPQHEKILPFVNKAEALTSPSRKTVWECLDRDFRCIELPGDEDSEETGLVHARIVESMARRRLEPRPAVSVVVPVYNPPPEYLREMVQSVMDQDHPDWELVLLENGDPTVSGPVIRELQDDRVRYYGGMGGRGIAMGRNLGNLLARGKMIATLDHDDLCAPDRISAVKNILAHDQNKILYSDAMLCFVDGSREYKNLKLSSPEELRRHCNIYHPSLAYTPETAREIPYDPRFEPSDDYRFYLAALRRGKEFVHVARPLLYYRKHPAQHSRTGAMRMEAVTRGALLEDKYLRDCGDPLDKTARFQGLVLSLLAYYRDEEARELMEAGYSPWWLSRFPEGEELSHLVNAEALRQLAYVHARREDHQNAASLLSNGLEAGLLGCRERSDLADFLFRNGQVRQGREEAGRAWQDDKTAGLAAFQTWLLESWIRKAGEKKPVPPKLCLKEGAGDDTWLSVIISADTSAPRLLKATLESLKQQEMRSLEVIVAGPGAGEAASAEGFTIKTVVTGSDKAEQYNRGAQEAGGEYVAFLSQGDVWEAGFAARAVQTLDMKPGIQALAGMVEAGESGDRYPARAVARSALLRDERVLLCGCIMKKDVLVKLGGFMPGLGRACGWEFLVRALAGLDLLQPGFAAGRSVRKPLLNAFPDDPEELSKEHCLAMLIKCIHMPLRYLDLKYAGVLPEETEKRLEIIAGLARRSPELVPFLDPWEFLAGYNSPYHLLYRLSKRLGKAGLESPARAALATAMRLRPFEPKLWFKYLSLSLHRSSF